jgi:hypothetical protein
MPFSFSSSPAPIPKAVIPNLEQLHAMPAKGVARLPATELIKIISPFCFSRILFKAGVKILKDPVRFVSIN